jgi:hypothetical protein
MGGKNKNQNPETDKGDDPTDYRPVPRSPLTEMWDPTNTSDEIHDSDDKKRDRHKEPGNE